MSLLLLLKSRLRVAVASSVPSIVSITANSNAVYLPAQPKPVVELSDNISEVAIKT